MATQAPLVKTSPLLPTSKGKKGTKPFHSVIEPAPNVRVAGGVVAPSRQDEQVSDTSGTVVAAGKFKATCLKLLDRAAQGETITITKHGRIVGRLIPPEPEKPKEFVPLWGRMRGQVKILGDIVSPDFEAWGMTDPRKKKKK